MGKARKNINAKLITAKSFVPSMYFKKTIIADTKDAIKEIMTKLTTGMLKITSRGS